MGWADDHPTILVDSIILVRSSIPAAGAPSSPTKAIIRAGYIKNTSQVGLQRSQVRDAASILPRRSPIPKQKPKSTSTVLQLPIMARPHWMWAKNTDVKYLLPFRMAMQEDSSSNKKALKGGNTTFDGTRQNAVKMHADVVCMRQNASR